MTVEVEEIRAWVDGELDESRANEVANAVLADDKLQRLADALRASVLPYQQAYKQISVPEVPESLRESIATLQKPTSVTTKNNGATKNKQAANNNWFKYTGIAASVMLAALVGYMAGNNTVTSVAPDVSESANSLDADNFAQTVATYQKFFVRDTLKGTIPPNPVKVSEQLANQTGMQVVIPELEGYEFMRAQRLTFDGNLLLQLIYLGAEGLPLALCYMIDADSVQGNETDTITAIKKHHGLNTAEWRQNGHRFVIISDAPEGKIEALSKSTKEQWSI